MLAVLLACLFGEIEKNPIANREQDLCQNTYETIFHGGVLSSETFSSIHNNAHISETKV